jgi:hypothetical protein
MTDNKKLKKTLTIRYNTDEDEEPKKEELKQGKPWTKDGVYGSYEAAATRRDSINEKSPEYATKIKRCGYGQRMFKVVKRLIKEPVKKKTKTKAKK